MVTLHYFEAHDLEDLYDSEGDKLQGQNNGSTNMSTDICGTNDKDYSTTSAYTVGNTHGSEIDVAPSSVAFPKLDLDLLNSIKGMYRILDLINEQGSSGTVDKVIIAQDSLQQFIDALCPGAYVSFTKINFRFLDNLSVEPIGVYGSKEAIVNLLCFIGAVDETIAQALGFKTDGLSGVSVPTLRSGLYIVRSLSTVVAEQRLFVIYWPEDTTWDDDAVSSVRRNRVTFMRYLTKITDQIVVLISSEHAKAIVWNHDSEDITMNVDDDDESDRLFAFEIAKTSEQEENVAVRSGFNITCRHIVAYEPHTELLIDPEVLTPRLLAGETVQAFMSARYVPPSSRMDAFSGPKNEIQLRNLLQVGGIQLSNGLANSHIGVLIKCGLMDRFPQVCDMWERRQEHLRKARETEIRENEAKMKNMLKEEEPQFLSTLTQVVVDEVLRRFPTLSREGLGVELPADDGFYKDYFLNMKLLPTFSNFFESAIRKATLESIAGQSGKAAAFKAQKLRLITAKLLLDEYKDSEEVPRHELVQQIMDDSRDTEKPRLFEEFKQQIRALFTTDSIVDKVIKESRKVNSATGDAEFLSSLNGLTREPLLHSAVLEVMTTAHSYFHDIIKRLTNNLTHRFRFLQEDLHKKRIRGEATTREEQEQAVARFELVQQIEKRSWSDNPSRLTFLKSMEPKSTYGYNASYEVVGHQEYYLDPAIEYKIHSLEMSAEHQERLRLDHTFIPSPRVEDRRSHSFQLPMDYRILHIQLLENNRCLLVVDDSRGNVIIYCEKISAIDAAVVGHRYRKLLHRDKIGQDFLLAFDEVKRILAVCSSAKLQLHIFIFGDETFTSLQALGSAINLTPWYTNPTSICHMCFVCGSEEVLLVDTSAQVRIFSLVTQQFRPASLDLEQIPTAVYSSPDGSCLIISSKNHSGLSLRAYHWSTFGSTEGTLLEFQDRFDSIMVVSSLLSRSNVHLIGLDVDAHQCRSFILDITSKVTQFTFQEKGGKSASQSGGNSTVHNCLIDCHAEVWTRFPVQPAIWRQTITSSSQRLQKTLNFITDRDHDAFIPHFSELIQSFERTTRKPTGDELKGIRVRASNFDPLVASLTGDSEWPVTCFKAGEWLVELLCLIPIHIAITRENRFIPLKDGVYSAELEKNLLGAEVNRIVDNLSFGWYESIFQSYLATKPVKVVSSMGEQSVGKSFTLNHLADTSFAGSAMRTTEGVWMSVAPTEEALIVALDFEGVDSLERSAQEDTFLVLFNTAISNLVLFRNNFTFSRDISGLFQSFQSSSTVLNPAANPSLFQSTLVIIIKDVVDSDKMEIKREFSLKFQKIVQDEQDANFISRLHGGKLNIIPWPVIESRQFYSLFSTLKRQLDHQKITHPAAGEFLHTLKILMAKLKANDWGALSQTLAAHRAQRLLSLLPNALALGLSEMEFENEPLKNFDTDVVIDAPDSPSRFHLLGPGNQPEEKELVLAALRQSWDRHPYRQNQLEHEWTAELYAYLTRLVDMRVDHVREWISSNLSRFKTNHANIEALRRKFESDVVDLKANIQLCKIQCGSCHLLCLRSRHHEGPHECQTSHECIHPCDFSIEHQGEQRLCGFSAGHSGRHICVVRNHLCGEPCKLYGRPGCLERCTEVMGHVDNDHSCSATKHACGEPCDLRQAIFADGQEYSCFGTCTIPVDEAHDHHYCDERMCPVPCQLCRRLCSDQNHLHALDAGAEHLCGQEHDCKALCSANGICEIDTAPQSIEATFTGRHETFQYTKYSQVAKRLPCVVPIGPGTIAHAGSHRHSMEQNSFHFCQTRCESCGYFCTLPLGHTQQEHETSHGSMSRTRWSVDGPHGSVLELNNRKFASDDDGAPMMCNIVCQAMGRHVHIDYCRAEPGVPCQNAESQHITSPLLPYPDRSKDWVTHSLYWRRTGFRDPYSREDQANFAKCDAMCSGSEHSASATNPAQPSYCTLPLFHDPHPLGRPAHGGMGHVSNDGHSFSCENPAMLQQAFHVIFLIDRSSSMDDQDRRPLGNTPVTALIAQRSNNRLGAVYSSLHTFWSARQAVVTSGQTAGRRDAYSVLLFDHEVLNCVTNNFTSSADQLLTAVLAHQARGGTNYTSALTSAQIVMQQHWSTERTPVVIFLSDGECSLTDQVVQDICRAAVALGKPLSFHSVSFGSQTSTASLRRMAQIALEFQNNAPRDPLSPDAAVVSSSYSEALDTVRLAETFLGFAESLSKPRGSLLNKH